MFRCAWAIPCAISNLPRVVVSQQKQHMYTRRERERAYVPVCVSLVSCTPMSTLHGSKRDSNIWSCRPLPERKCGFLYKTIVIHGPVILCQNFSVLPVTRLILKCFSHKYVSSSGRSLLQLLHLQLARADSVLWVAYLCRDLSLSSHALSKGSAVAS